LDLSDRKHALHVGHPEQFLNAKAYTRDAQENAFAPAADVMTDQRVEAERIHVGNLCQFKDLLRRPRLEDVANGSWGQSAMMRKNCHAGLKLRTHSQEPPPA
jgi:hypothetical protein